MKHFFTILKEGGFSKRQIIEEIPMNNRLFVLHQNEHGLLAISDYLTGRQVTDGVNKEQIKEVAESILTKNADFDFDIYPRVNTPKALKMFSELETFVTEIKENEKTPEEWGRDDFEISIKFDPDDFSHF